MPVDIAWDDDAQTRMRYRFYDKWTWQDAWEAMSQAKAMSEQVDHTVDALIDLRDNNWFPPGAITQFRASSKMRPNNRGYIVIITDSVIINTIPRVIQAIFPHNKTSYHAVRTEEEAFALLEELHGDTPTDDPTAQSS